MILKDSGNEDLMQNTLEKTIDENSKDLMFKVLQSHQYRYPVKSAIRETASNGVDSHNERDMAVKILTGVAEVSDYYEVENSESGMQHSSKFDPEYYDLKWLSEKPQTRITYIERDEENRDLIQFEDWGVGLGGSRLEGFFSLAYSTKRGNKKLIGGWGLGAKAFLATDIDSFRVTSFYNGKKFVFDVYETTVNSVTPKFGGNGKNNIFTFPKSGYQCYYENTERKNGVIVEATVVKSQKYDYQRAVKTQLLYMSKVDFYIHNSWGRDYKEDFQATILYSDENILISSNSVQSKPHILMGDPDLGTLINYGYVDFEALEMSQYYGSVGIIVSPGEVDISTSRENLLWKKKTRLGIQRKFDLVRDTAENYVKEKISVAEDNLFNWVEALHSIISSSKSNYSSNSNRDNVLAQLAKVVDIDQISFEKASDSTGNFVYSPVTKYFKSKENVVISRYITQANVSYSYRDTVGTVKRTGIANWGTLFNAKIYLVASGEKITGASIRYLKKYNSEIVFISENGYEHNTRLEAFVKAGIKAGKIYIYSDLVIPKEELESLNKIEEAVGLTLQEKRKLEGKVVLKSVDSNGWPDNEGYTKEEIGALTGIYGEHSYSEDLKALSKLDGTYNNVYIASESTVKIIEETNSPLKYFKDSLYSVSAGEITFLVSGINNYIKTKLHDEVSNGTLLFISPEDVIKAKYLGLTKITTLDSFKIERTLLTEFVQQGANNYSDLGYHYGNSYIDNFTAYIKQATIDLINGEPIKQLDKYSKFKGIELATSFKDYSDKISSVRKWKKLNEIIARNESFIRAYNQHLITLEQLNSQIQIKF